MITNPVLSLLWRARLWILKAAANSWAVLNLPSQAQFSFDNVLQKSETPVCAVLPVGTPVLLVCIHWQKKKRISPDYFCCFAKPWKASELLLSYFMFLTGFFAKHGSDAPLKVVIDVSHHHKCLFRFHSYDCLAKGKQNVRQVPFHPTSTWYLRQVIPGSACITKGS